LEDEIQKPPGHVVSNSVGDIRGTLTDGEKLEEPVDLLFDSPEAGAVFVELAVHVAT
jgi:hypothetical protein